MSTRRTTMRMAAPLTLAALVATATACGGTADAKDGGTAGSANRLTITATGMAYTITGHPRPGHVDITFANRDDAAHEAEIVKLENGKTIKDVLADMQKGGEDAARGDLDGSPEQMAYGTPAMLSGGQRTEVVSRRLQPGTYGVLCFLPGPDGMPHVAMGMGGQFTVSRGTAQTATPTSAGTVRLTDSGIHLPARFGRGTYAVTNTGTTPHSFSLARLDGTLADFYSYIGGQFAQNKPIDGGPGALVGGTTTLLPGQTAWLHVDLAPGHYGYVSTIQGQDPSDSDYARGLQGEFTVR